MRTDLIKKEKDVKKKVKDNVKLDMVIAFDTTGSMFPYIGDVKRHVTTLVPELFEIHEDLNIGVVAFGDYCDMIDKGVFGKAYQCLDLNDNEEDIITFIKNAQNTSGGDGDEFYELVLKKIIEETSWREDSNKAILLIADANPHELGYSYNTRVINNQIDWREEVKKASKEGIKIDTIAINPDAADYWLKEVSETTQGIHSPFQSSEKTSDLIRAATYSRGGESSRVYFTKMMSSTDDVELSMVYKAYSKEIV